MASQNTFFISRYVDMDFIWSCWHLVLASIGLGFVCFRFWISCSLELLILIHFIQILGQISNFFFLFHGLSRHDHLTRLHNTCRLDYLDIAKSFTMINFHLASIMISFTLKMMLLIILLCLRFLYFCGFHYLPVTTNYYNSIN